MLFLFLRGNLKERSRYCLLMRTRVHASVYAAQRRPSFKMHAQSALDASQVCACMQQQLFQLETIRCNFKCASIRVAFQRRCVVNEAAGRQSWLRVRAAEGGRTLTSLTASKVKASSAKRVSKRLTQTLTRPVILLLLSVLPAGRPHTHTTMHATMPIDQQVQSNISATFRARREIRASIIERHRLCMCMQMPGAHLHICLYFERGERRTPVLTFDCGSYFMRPIGREPLTRAQKNLTAAIKLVLVRLAHTKCTSV